MEAQEFAVKVLEDLLKNGPNGHISRVLGLTKLYIRDTILCETETS